MTHRVSPSNALGVVVIAAVLSGCSAFRVHDTGKHSAAQQAAELAAEVAETELGFDAMLSNVDSIGEVRSEFLDQHRRNELEAFLDDLAEFTNEDAAGIIEEAETAHAEARDALNGAIATAVDDVNKALDRQKTIRVLLREQEKDSSSLEETIDRIDARLGWLDGQIDKAREILGVVSAGDAEAGEDAFGEDLAGRLADYRETLDSIGNDDAVADARKLFAQLKREVTQLETERLLAFRTHLRRLETLRDSFDKRDEVFHENLVLPARSALDAWATNGTCAPLNDDTTLAEFIAAAAAPAGCGPAATGPRLAVGLVERLMLLQFSEIPRDENLLIELERTRHREALRVSSTNARQHLSLVQQVTDALQIYYAGGIKPEDMASLALAATQVGALVFIGDNVD